MTRKELVDALGDISVHYGGTLAGTFATMAASDIQAQESEIEALRAQLEAARAVVGNLVNSCGRLPGGELCYNEDALEAAAAWLAGQEEVGAATKSTTPHLPCPDCYGEGTIFEGAWMNSNPSSYADYEEIWRKCPKCGSAGVIKLTPGTQIVYVPMHAAGDTGHPDAEAGFVTSVRGDTAFCRYWSKSYPGALRTQANSEGTPIEMLVVRDTRPQAVVDALLVMIERETQNG